MADDYADIDRPEKDLVLGQEIQVCCGKTALAAVEGSEGAEIAATILRWVAALTFFTLFWQITVLIIALVLKDVLLIEAILEFTIALFFALLLFWMIKEGIQSPHTLAMPCCCEYCTLLRFWYILAIIGLTLAVFDFGFLILELVKGKSILYNSIQLTEYVFEIPIMIYLISKLRAYKDLVYTPQNV